MFTALQSEVADRFLTTQLHFTATCQPNASPHDPTTKGLVFVGIYANYEFALKSVVSTAIQFIKQTGLQFDKVSWNLVPLLLDAELTAISDAGAKTKWRKRVGFINKLTSQNVIDTVDDAFPSDGTHFRLSQIYAVWEAFGINAPVIPAPRLTPLVGEVVENRNAISHGRRTAADVGKAYSRDDILDKITDMQSICLHIISTVELHCAHQPNLVR